MTSAPLTALVLAGTRSEGDSLAAFAGVDHKAMIDIGGRPMLSYVLEALASSAHVARIVVAIERPEILSMLPHFAKPVTAVPAAAGPSASVALALQSEGLPLLVTTADHPLLRPEWVEEIIAGAPGEADVVAGLARRAAVEAASVRTRRTYLRFSGGDYSGCNLFLLRRDPAAGAVRLWSELEAYRKQPMKMLRRLGFSYAVRYRLGLLSIDAALRRLGEIAHARLGFVEMRDGRAAVDVDTPEDLRAVRKLLCDA